MQEKDIFATACWNFIGGDRQIERILRELPSGQPVVVRNRLGNVLATAAGLHDLDRLDPWEKLPLKVLVPENALVERGLSLDEPVATEAFFETLLARIYGIRARRTEAAVPAGALLLALPVQGPEAGVLAAWLSEHAEVPVIFLQPAGEALPDALRPFAAEAWSAQRWMGLNAFARPTVEEAVAELAPAHVLVAGGREVQRAHTAIGAADYFIRRERAQSERELREAGARVSVLTLGAPQAAGAARSLRELVKEHLEKDLGVVSTAADARFKVTEEAIALDIA